MSAPEQPPMPPQGPPFERPPGSPNGQQWGPQTGQHQNGPQQNGPQQNGQQYGPQQGQGYGPPPTRERQGPRHRSPPVPRAAGGRAEPDALAAEQDGELDSYLAALAPSAGPEDTSLTGRFGHAQVFQLRLPAVRIEQLRRIAQERGVSPGALAVDWVIDRLDREDTPTGPFAVVEEAEKRRRGPLRKLGLRGR